MKWHTLKLEFESGDEYHHEFMASDIRNALEMVAVCVENLEKSGDKVTKIEVKPE